jgi:hypothetical protein
MGLFKRGLKHERLTRFSGAQYWTIFTLGRELGELVHSQATRALRQLQELPGTTSADLNDIVRAANTILPLTRDLDKHDEELQRASDMELQGCLFGIPGLVMVDGHRRFNAQGSEAYPEIHQRMLAWTDSLTEPQRTDAQAVIEERRELCLHLLEMCASFTSTTNSISASHRQYRLAHSVAKLDVSSARPRLPLAHQLEQVQGAAQVAEVVGAGVDATYPLPALSELDAAPEPTAVDSSGLEL